MQFQVLHSLPNGPRLGRVTLANGFSYETPSFMPVATQATVKALSSEDLEACGAGMLLSNTYHLSLRPGAELIQESGGLHRFMNWKRGILTDSGGFQVMSLARLVKISDDGVRFQSHIDGSPHFFTPERVIDLQFAFGVNAMTCLDICKGYPATAKEAREALETTLKWAKRSMEHFEKQSPSPRHGESPTETCPLPINGAREDNNNFPSPRLRGEGRVRGEPLLFGIIQGGFDVSVRKEAVQRMKEIGFKAFAFGGLSVGEPKEITWEIIRTVNSELEGVEAPRYLMGVGDPLDFLEACRWGIDMTDCVLPTRNARNGQALTSLGKIYIKNAAYRRDSGPLDPDCACLTCRNYSRHYLCHLYHAEELLLHRLLSLHNIAFMLRLAERIRTSISGGTFEEFYSQFRNRYLGGAELQPAASR